MSTEDQYDEWSEYVKTVTNKEGIRLIKQWLEKANMEYEYMGYTSDMDTRYESHWWIPDERNRILFTLRWGRSRLD